MLSLQAPCHRSVGPDTSQPRPTLACQRQALCKKAPVAAGRHFLASSGTVAILACREAIYKTATFVLFLKSPQFLESCFFLRNLALV